MVRFIILFKTGFFICWFDQEEEEEDDVGRQVAAGDGRDDRWPLVDDVDQSSSRPHFLGGVASTRSWLIC